METNKRVSAFHAAVGKNFSFLSGFGYRLVERKTIADRYGSNRFVSEDGDVIFSWDAYDGNLEASIDGHNLWDVLRANGEWDRSGYQAYAVPSMQHASADLQTSYSCIRRCFSTDRCRRREATRIQTGYQLTGLTGC